MGFLAPYLSPSFWSPHVEAAAWPLLAAHGLPEGLLGVLGSQTTLGISAAATALWLAPKAVSRLRLSRAKHRSLVGHARISRKVARLVPFFSYDEQGFFSSDGAPSEIAGARRAGFFRLASLYNERYPRGQQLTGEVENHISDLQFTSRYRVPFPFSAHVRAHLKAGAFVERSEGVQIFDIDGNAYYDLTGSYGVNVFGYQFYAECMTAAVEKTRSLGPVLGSYHPVLADNIRRLVAISGLDEVSFHMSGTEAVMQAIRLARYHTRRTHVVRFCGAYHGWSGDVQPGVGNPTVARETYTLSDMSEKTLQVLRTRNDIACVLINPLQALHPNRNAPSDSMLMSGRGPAAFDRDAYSTWLTRVREVCNERGIVLILDEVFVGFRLAAGGAQAYFGIEADMVTYGKTLGGGFPVGVLCGKGRWMRRFREDRPTDICFARGTFNSHPTVMAAMNEFLRRIDTPEVSRMYEQQDEVWTTRAEQVNEDMRTRGLPLRVAHLQSIWTVYFDTPGRYHWMLQYYLRAEGLALSWVGTGRFIFSLNYSDVDFNAVRTRLVAAAEAMERDGWWWYPPGESGGDLNRRFLRDLFNRHRHATSQN